MRKPILPSAEPLEARRLFSVHPAAAFASGVISGTVFNDTNSNGKRDAGETAVSGRKVYIDANKNGKFDSTEKSITTGGLGTFSFTKLAAGTYIVREVIAAGKKLSARFFGSYSATVSAAKPSFTTASFGEVALQPTVDLQGEYLTDDDGSVIEFDLRRVGTSKSSYGGDLVSDGIDLKFTGAESYLNVLTGTVKDVNGKSHAVTATFKGKTLTALLDGQTSLLTKVSSTPAPAPPTLTQHTGQIFTYKSPSSWHVSEGTQGILINSADGTQQVGILAGYNDGVFGTAAVVQSEVNSGAKVAYSKTLVNGYIGIGLYAQRQAVLVTFTYKGKAYASGQVITTVTDYYGGQYDPFTGTYSGDTLTIIDMVTAPAQQYVSDSATLGNILASIQQKSPTGSAAALVNQAALSGLPKAKPALDDEGYYDPGVEGDWSSYGGFDYSSNPWLYDEQSYMADTSYSFDTQLDDFDGYILE